MCSLNPTQTVDAGHCVYLFERAITKFRNRLGRIYKTYFNGEERIGLGLEQEPKHQPEVFISLLAVSLVGAVLTVIYLWSVR